MSNPITIAADSRGLAPASPSEKAAFADCLAQIDRLSRGLQLAFRLEVGKLMLEHFYAGSIAAYRDTARNKESSFAAFTRTCKQELADYGLGPQSLRNCINARVIYDLLPPSTRDVLKFSHVVELTRVADPNARARMAMDVALQHWSVDQLKGAIAQYRDGTYYDTEPLTPGTQPPRGPAVADKPLARGRLVSQLAKTAAALDAWHAAWTAAAKTRLDRPQRDRYRAAVAALRAKVDELAADLDGDRLQS